MTVTVNNLIYTLVERNFDHKETIMVLRHNINKYWSWGVSKSSIMIKDSVTVGLVLLVNGRHFKGYVLVTLGWDDVYKVHFITTRGTLKKTIDNVYVDELTDTIDGYIEYIPEYN